MLWKAVKAVVGGCCERLLWEAAVGGCCGRLLWGAGVGDCCVRLCMRLRLLWEVFVGAVLGGRHGKLIQPSLHICSSYETTSDFSVAPSPAETWKQVFSLWKNLIQ
jgi:hypothetical protein